MRRLPALLAALALLAASPALAAADPAGDWTGTLRLPGRDLVLGLEVRRGPDGRWSARYDDISQNYRGFAMRPSGAGDPPPFELKSPFGQMTYAWNPDRGRWEGVWRQKGGVYRLTLARGTIPPAAISPLDRLSLGGFVVLMLLEAAGIARLLQLRRRRRLRARSR